MVVAIIALLVSILLPSLNRAKELARRAVCLSQQHSIALAQTIYAVEYDDRFLIGYWGAPLRNYWVKVWDTYILHGMLYDLKYLSDPRALYCPSVKPYDFAFDNQAPASWAPHNPYNPWSGENVRAPLTPRPEVKWSSPPPRVLESKTWPRLSDFAGKAICADACTHYWYVSHTHGDGINVAYGDGSAQWVSGNLFMDDLKAIPDDDDYSCYDIWKDVFDEQH